MSTVLIVDDSPSDRALFRILLSREGYTVLELARGEEAVTRAKEARPHVIILDVNLPDTDGHSVCRALKADSLVSGIPVLMLTVRDDERDILAGLEAGADDYVAKDAPSEIILARVRRLVRYRQMATVSVLNEQLAQSGKLLAGIVHEIRGPLSVIRGNAELMKLSLSEDHEALQWVEPIIRGCQLLQVRLEHLMAAVRVGPSRLQRMDLGPLVREAIDLFEKGTDPRSEGVRVEAEFRDKIPAVNADPGRLIQVLLNLLSNAYEAVATAGSGGTIWVAVDRAQRGDAANWARIEVYDSGPGIPQNVLNRVFEPFFTTKPTGSGYGLYLASEILREHGGHLEARNLPQGGACFTLWLPEADRS
jgi:signal transduction histidine kinase